MALRRVFHPLNPQKYNGPQPIILKSSWEEVFARNYCDLNTNCVEWSYESWRIPYEDPLTARQTIYIPDFLMSYRSNQGHVKTALIEIKPLHEAKQEFARNLKDAANVAKNMAKWQAARFWCERRNNVEFVILTEAELFSGGENIKPPKRRRKKT